MKIAFIVDWFPNLSETFILSQITGLLDRGHEVDIFASGPSTQAVRHADIEKYNLLDRVFYHEVASRIMPENKIIRLIKAVALFFTNFHKKPMPLLRSLNILKFGKTAASLSLFYKTITFLKNDADKYDIVHCHFGPNGNLAALLKDVGVIKGKVITTFHGYDITKYIAERESRYYDRLFEIGDLFLPISERWKNELIKLGCPEQKIVVHRMGVDTCKFFLSPRRQTDNKPLQLLTVARLVEKKGVKYSVEAVAKVLKTYPHIEYNIAGDGPLRADLENLIDTLKVNGKIKLLGWKRQNEIVELMREADIFLAPSVTSEDGDQEGIPVVLIEALAQGLPVLSTQHSGIPELIQDGVSGFLVPERDTEALVEKLEHLVRHPQIWPEMGKAGRSWVEKYYDINKLNDQLVQLYEHLLNGRLYRSNGYL